MTPQRPACRLTLPASLHVHTLAKSIRFDIGPVHTDGELFPASCLPLPTTGPLTKNHSLHFCGYEFQARWRCLASLQIQMRLLRRRPQPQHIPKARGPTCPPQWKVVASRRLPQAFPPPFQEGLLERGVPQLGDRGPVRTQSSRPVPNFLRERVTTLSKRPLPRGRSGRPIPVSPAPFIGIRGCEWRRG